MSVTYFLEKYAISSFITRHGIESSILGRSRTEIWPGIQKRTVIVFTKIGIQELLSGVIGNKFFFGFVFIMQVEMSVNVKI